MTLAEFYKEYFQLEESNSSYRLGQHFINSFIKDVNTGDYEALLQGLYNEEDIPICLALIAVIITDYNWDHNNLPLLNERSI